MIPFETFQTAHRRRERQDFLGEVRHPHLVVLDRRSPRSSREETQRLRVDAPEPPAQARGLLPVRRTSSLFSLLITVGRSPDNDIVLEDPRVSKFHGYLRETEGEWTYVDANSTNGTYLNDVRLPAEQPIRIGCGDELRFGESRGLFLTPDALYAYLRRRQPEACRVA